jgi:hypothetical protein
MPYQVDNEVTFGFEDHDMKCSHFFYDANKLLKSKQPSTPMGTFLYVYPIYAESVMNLQKSSGVQIEVVLRLFGMTAQHYKENLKENDVWTSETP